MTDEHGNRTAVIIPVEEYEELLQDLADLATLNQRQDGPHSSLEEVEARLRQDGLLED